MEEAITKDKLESIVEEIKRNTGENVAVFIDFDNIYHGFRNYGINIEGEECNLIDLMWNCYGRDKIRVIKAYADFEQVKVSLRLLQKQRVQIRQVYGNGLGEQYRKNASDIELSIDAIEASNSDESIDTFVFVTADSDMIPVMSRMIFKGKKVHLFYIGENVSKHTDLVTYSHHNLDLIDAFDIDTDRKHEHYWTSSLKEYIPKWYSESKNRNKALGGGWLKDGLMETYYVSPELASRIIAYHEDSGLIVKKKIGNYEGYVLSADVEKQEVAEKETVDK